MNNQKQIIFSIDIISDYDCPWCYIGKTRLDNAIKQFQEKNQNVTFELNLLPYMIDTSININGEEYMKYNVKRWGGDGWTQSMIQSSAKDGCNFKSWKWWPNPLLAHQLVYLAKKHNLSKKVDEIIFQKLYEQGENLSNLEVILKVAKESGLTSVINEEEIKKQLNSQELINEIKKLDQFAKKQQQIGGVPYFIINIKENSQEKFELSGAQASKQWIKLFEQFSQN